MSDDLERCIQCVCSWRDAVQEQNLEEALSFHEAVRKALDENPELQIPWGVDGIPTVAAFNGWWTMVQRLQSMQPKDAVEAEAGYAAAYEKLQAAVKKLGKAGRPREVVLGVAEVRQAIETLLLASVHLKE